MPRKPADKIETNDLGMRAVATGYRTVRNDSVSINRREYWGNCLKGLNGRTVIVRVRDTYASVYGVYDTNWKSIGECHEPSEIEKKQRGN